MVSRQDIVAAPFYQGYIAAVPEEEVNKALKKSGKLAGRFLEGIPRKKVLYVYAEGKWSIAEVLQHIIDAERVFAYRALCFARRDSTPLPGFDEVLWAQAVAPRVPGRKWKDLLEEFSAQRCATELLFRSFSDEQLLFAGTASGQPANALAMGFVSAGHLLHHLRILQERYL